MWRIVIPNWIPPYLNTARGRHWNKSAANTRAVADVVKVYALKAGVPFVYPAHGTYTPRRKLTVDVVKYGKLPDPDNLLKHLLDGLKLAGLIVDDSAKWCEWERPTLERLKGPKQSTGWGTVIVLADIPERVESVQGEHHGVRFTRAVVRERHWHKGMPNDPRDFVLYFDCNGEEEVWTAYTAATKAHCGRLVAWCEVMGVRVDVEPLSVPAARPAAVLPDPDLFG